MKPFPQIKKSHRGLLHKKLGVKLGTKIPIEKLNKAAQSDDPKLRKEAIYAINFGH